ncbi:MULTISPECIES: DegT/DnrJ/EryC1/StrS aminotransferase family protein [Niallia]|uniref:Aminotransferase class I/II-fold pyridoxal phosphate-dependent enzyme n=1 Tax=Niallia alba TaxID=2729105 RepID=A0A7Y0PP10_9BACI|nr:MULTISPECIES: aminotransferase class I/II-fold pyridoxal phosphate-dependent enzyme [Niallia]NMO79415.1 aminotransferase class I/II-fold pyridoxal phosphate-dependent enzyme [Niallia alba]UTI42719.1 aminotransferase class I/II-fold pyridoxal phosphate-dependent enzyme [Niallia sp. RD1]
MNKKIYLSSPHMSGNEMQYINAAFDSNWIAPIGENIEFFEKELSEYVNIKHAVALSSGTAAIHMALKFLGISKGDFVFCSSLTFAASANPIVYQNATPVFIDSEPNSWNMSPIALRKAFKKYKPKAVIVVHLYGQAASMDEIMQICKEYNVPVIEDAAESLGGTYKGNYTGTIGDFGIYSFNGNKIITTSGGGMLVSNNRVAIDKVRFWSSQSKDNARYYQHSELGYNYRMSNILAGIGRGQLTELTNRINSKKSIYDSYLKSFEEIEAIKMMPIQNYGTPNYWLSCFTLDINCGLDPIDIIIALEKNNIESRPVWKPLHLQPFYKSCDFINHNNYGISISEQIFNRGICLPSDTKMSEIQINKVVKIIKELFR